jgi:hypothetical protein
MIWGTVTIAEAIPRTKSTYQKGLFHFTVLIQSQLINEIGLLFDQKNIAAESGYSLLRKTFQRTVNFQYFFHNIAVELW